MGEQGARRRGFGVDWADLVFAGVVMIGLG